LSHDQLVEMAKEVGIDQDAVEAATAELAQSRADELARDTEAKELAQERVRLLGHFAGSLVTYLVVNAVLYFIDHKFTGGTWYYWVLLGWGIGLLLQFRQALFPKRSLEHRKLREWKRAQKLARRAERDERRQKMIAAWSGGHQNMVNQGAREFEQAVQAGVAALLSVAARKISDHAERQSNQFNQINKRSSRRL